MGTYWFKHYRGSGAHSSAGVLISARPHKAIDVTEAVEHAKANFLTEFNPQTDFAVLFDEHDMPVWEKDERSTHRISVNVKGPH